MSGLEGRLADMSETQTLPDTRPLFFQALDQLTPLIDGVTAADLDGPTPCEGWSVRDLLGHLVAVSVRIPHIAAGGQPDEVPSQVSGIADNGWAAAWHERVGAVRGAVSPDEGRGRIVSHPAGQIPWAVAVGIYASELATHAWDLARALGRDSQLDQSIAAGVLAPMKGALPAEPRGVELGIPFGPVVEVGPDATPYQQLVGWLGRDPGWTTH